MEKSAEVDGFGFKWGKKRGNGVENKDVQFYESFTYDGSEYSLYDCVLLGVASKPDSPEFFVGKIIKMWEHTDQRQNPRNVELLWFFKPSELSRYLQRVQDVLPNELFLASGSGVGLTNANQLEAICGKCNVQCISKDKRNPQPSSEEIKLADFVFHRTFDVQNSKILEKIDDKIAGVDVKFIFNRTSCEKKASAVQKVATGVHGTAHSLKPNRPSTSGSVRQNERNARDLYGHRKSDYGHKKEEDNDFHKQLARKKSAVAEERSNKDPGRRDGELDNRNASGSRRNDCNGKKDQDNEVENQLRKQKSRLAEEGCSRDSYCLEDLPRKKRKLDGSVAVSKHTEEKRLSDANYRRDYGVFDVTQKPHVTWEEDLGSAEGRGTLVLLQNLDPTCTSSEVENIVYSALNEQCTARMIERTSITIPHLGEALVIFKTADAAKRVIKRLDEGCLLLSNGRTLVATSAKVNPPEMPRFRFPGHIKPRIQIRREMRNAVATSHCAQRNTIEFDMGMEWRLHRDRFELACKRIFEVSIDHCFI
ncbi:unnamed protein product [Microthlaspi erraticum]|uniref:BAH domain-containing protein n=1 Tax=Microthlaspi erraticum TaxID=1685480 RepID=A0A6D2IL97_9BRAS|nr:unnamed protein product [Microthlaspi erraticum]